MVHLGGKCGTKYNSENWRKLNFPGQKPKTQRQEFFKQFFPFILKTIDLS